MEIIVNGRLACLKKNTSFEYIAENPLFTGSDGYTLTITFPLKDCPENISIFGHLHRQDVEKNKVVFDCEIRDKQFYKAGCITITQISDVEVKTQFLEGRSEQNFKDTFDNIYLNQLDLGTPDNRRAAYYETDLALECGYPLAKYVALPWVNNTSGNLQNAVTISSSGSFQWDSSLKDLSFQPYLLYILQKICSAVNYTGTFTEISNSNWKYLIFCNTLPAAWGLTNFASAMPHWSLTEFFEQLELLMDGEFTINHKSRTIRFDFSYKIAKKAATFYTDQVINKYSVDVALDDKSDYIASKNKAYADNDNRLWPYRSCQWYIAKNKDKAVKYNTLSELLNYTKTLKESGIYVNGSHKLYARGYKADSDGNKLFYARDVDTYFIMYCYKSELYETTHMGNKEYHWYKYYNRLMPVNQFGKFFVGKDAEEVELNMVPAWIDDTEETLGPCLFLECGDMGSAVTWNEESAGSGSVTNGDGNRMGGVRTRSFSGSRTDGRQGDTEPEYGEGALAQSLAGKAIEKGDQQKADAYFDKIYVAFWDGVIRKAGKLPRPIVDKIEIDDDFTATKPPYSLRLEPKKGVDSQYTPYDYTFKIDNKKKYFFSFLADKIPNPRAEFYIEGGHYICEKLTATFHEDSGMSQLIKGTFYRII